MELLDLKLLCDLVELKSYSKAADVNNLTQPAVSRRIAIVNEEYGGKLFANKSRALLSPQGREVYGRFKDILDIYERSRRAVLAAEPPTLAAGLCDNARQRLMTPAFYKALLASGLRVDIGYASSSAIMEQIIWGVLDYGIVGSAPKPDANVAASPLYTERIVLATAHNPCGSAAKLADLPLLLDSRQSGLHMFLETALEEHGITLDKQDIVARIGMSRDKPALLEASRYCAFVPDHMVAAESSLRAIDVGLDLTRTFYEVSLKKNTENTAALSRLIKAANTLPPI